MGEPQHQMAAANDSANGDRHSSASAVAPKHESRGPQPSSQHSGHVEDMASWTNCGASAPPGRMRILQIYVESIETNTKPNFWCG